MADRTEAERVAHDICTHRVRHKMGTISDDCMECRRVLAYGKAQRRAGKKEAVDELVAEKERVAEQLYNDRFGGDAGQVVEAWEKAVQNLRFAEQS